MREALRVLVSTYEDIQQERIRAENRLRTISNTATPEVFEHLTRLKLVEEGIARDIKKLLKEEPVYEEFLRHVKGVGAILSAKLLSLPLDATRNVSAWWSFFGLVPHYFAIICEKEHKYLAPKVKPCPECGAQPRDATFYKEAPRKKKGYRAFWNPKARTLAFLLMRSFNMQKDGYYKEVINEYMLRQENQNLTQAHKRARALRYAVKLFISHFYQATCEIHSQPYQMPYAIEILSHDSFIHWKEVVARERAYV